MQSVPSPTSELPDTLETERLILRPYQPGDGTWYYDVALRNKAHLARYEGGNAIMRIEHGEDAERVVREFAAMWDAREALFLAAMRRSDGAFVAQVYIGPSDPTLPSFDIGYFGDVDHLRHGYVTEAVRAALDLVFGPLGARRASIRCDDTNLASARVAERCGFVREGHLRQDHRHGDHPASGTLCYGMLRKEYRDVTGRRPG